MYNENMTQRRLQYNYAQILLPSGFCVACFTSSDEIIGDDFISLPSAYDEYVDKYYNFYGDKKWYWDEDFTQLWEECPSH